MRNDLKDDPIDIPSLTIDKDDSLENGDWDVAHKGGMASPVQTSSKKFWGYILLLLFILYSAAMVGLFWICKQAADSVQHQLDEKTTSTSILTQATSGQLQKISEQINHQQDTMKENLDNIRVQNKQLAARLTELANMQQKVVAKQELYDKQLTQMQDKLIELAKLASTNDKTKQLDELTSQMAILKKTQVSDDTFKSLMTDVQAIKKQNLPQAIKSVQDDLLLLRSQLDTSANQSMETVQSNFNSQLKDIQTKLQTMQKQLDNRSPY